MRSIADQIAQKERDMLDEVIAYFGTKVTLARALGVTRQVVYDWQKRGRISAVKAAELEKLTKGHFKKEDLRPDVTTWFK